MITVPRYFICCSPSQIMNGADYLIIGNYHIQLAFSYFVGRDIQNPSLGMWGQICKMQRVMHLLPSPSMSSRNGPLRRPTLRCRRIKLSLSETAHSKMTAPARQKKESHMGFSKHYCGVKIHQTSKSFMVLCDRADETGFPRQLRQCLGLGTALLLLTKTEITFAHHSATLQRANS